MADDRLKHLATQPYLKGVAFRRMAYRPYREGWDHDHCVGCWAKFAEHGPEVLTEGYTTTADYQHGAHYEWVCPACFEDFRQVMFWTEVYTGRSSSGRHTGQ